MKQVFILLAPLLLFYTMATAQKEYKKSLTGITRIEISAETAIEIKKGNEAQLIIKEVCKNCSEKEDPRAKGLKPVYSDGVDNSGLGMAINQEGEVLRIKDLKGYINRSPLTIVLPSTVALSLNCGNLGSATVDGWSAELEVKTNIGAIQLRNVTGPVTASSSTGDIEVDFSSLNQQTPTSIISSTGAIDVSLPAATNAKVDMKAAVGGVFSNFDLVKPREDGLKPIGGNTSIAANINNGGVKLSLTAGTGNIYLRKK